ncbi:molecular chaperone [Ponticaulis profundi]|uniref:Molecular chaperone n=1 Tax=Ponticaulis profundi TaxID=2665222 RepID=A0ABW1SD11_9PROT
MSVTPIVFDLEAAGRNANTQLRVTNTSTGDIPVAISVSEVTMSEAGEVSAASADDDFVIFPFQALIPPGATQVFRVQYVGDPELEASKSYIFSVAQQPVALPEGVSGIQILYNFEVVGSVSPLGGEADLTLLSSELVTNDDGTRRAALTVKNPSNTHAYLSGSRLELTAKDETGEQVWSRSWRPQEIGQTVGVGLVQPGKDRRFVLPFDLPEGGSSLEASIRYIGRR